MNDTGITAESLAVALRIHMDERDRLNTEIARLNEARALVQKRVDAGTVNLANRLEHLLTKPYSD